MLLLTAIASVQLSAAEAQLPTQAVPEMAIQDVVFLTLEYPPYSSEAMHNYGAAVELLHHILKGTAWRAKVVFVPWSRVEHELKAGRADGALLLWPAEVEKYQVLSSSPMFISRLGFYVRSADLPDADVNLQALQGKRVCTVRGYGYPAELAEAKVVLDEALSDEINLKRVSMKRCDYVALERAVGEYILSSDKEWSLQTQVAWKEPAFAELPLSIAINPGKPHAAALMAAIETGLSNFRQTPTYDALIRTYSLDKPD